MQNLVQVQVHRQRRADQALGRDGVVRTPVQILGSHGPRVRHGAVDQLCSIAECLCLRCCNAGWTWGQHEATHDSGIKRPRYLGESRTRGDASHVGSSSGGRRQKAGQETSRCRHRRSIIFSDECLKMNSTSHVRCIGRKTVDEHHIRAAWPWGHPTDCHAEHWQRDVKGQNPSLSTIVQMASFRTCLMRMAGVRGKRSFKRGRTTKSSRVGVSTRDSEGLFRVIVRAIVKIHVSPGRPQGHPGARSSQTSRLTATRASPW